MDTERWRQEEDAKGEKLVDDEMWLSSKVEEEGAVRHRTWASYWGGLFLRSSRGKPDKLASKSKITVFHTYIQVIYT